MFNLCFYLLLLPLSLSVLYRQAERATHMFVPVKAAQIENVGENVESAACFTHVMNQRKLKLDAVA